MAKFSDVVVLLPGIMGSVLTKDGKEVWALSGEALLRAVFSNTASLKSLALAQDDPLIDNMGDGVEANRLFSDLHLIPGFWKIDGYSRISKYLINTFELKPGQNFFEFPYDWRRHNAVAARRLKNNSLQWLNKWKKSSGNANARLVLVAHSMGGLVSRYFLEVLGGWEFTRMLITFGTPFRGSLNALNFISNGLKIKVGPLVLTDLTDMLRSFTSVYQLLPIFPCVDMGDGKHIRIHETDQIPNVNQTRARESFLFHKQMTDAYESNKTDKAYNEKSYSLYPIIGTFQHTLQSAYVQENKCGMLATFDGEDMTGDGTVPRVSAVPVGYDFTVGSAIDTCHGSLQNSDDALTNVWYKLTGASIDGFRLGVKATAICQVGLMVDDLYFTNEKIQLKVKSDDPSQKVNVTLVQSSTGNVVQSKTCELKDDSWRDVELKPVPKGDYRIHAAIKDNSTASDALVVMEK